MNPANTGRSVISLQSFADGLDIFLGSAAADGRDSEGFGLLAGDDRTDYSRHLVIRKANLGAKAFCLNRQIHHADGSNRGNSISHHFHPLCLYRALSLIKSLSVVLIQGKERIGTAFFTDAIFSFSSHFLVFISWSLLSDRLLII